MTILVTPMEPCVLKPDGVLDGATGGVPRPQLRTKQRGEGERKPPNHLMGGVGGRVACQMGGVGGRACTLLGVEHGPNQAIYNHRTIYCEGKGGARFTFMMGLCQIPSFCGREFRCFRVASLIFAWYLVCLFYVFGGSNRTQCFALWQRVEISQNAPFLDKVSILKETRAGIVQRKVYSISSAPASIISSAQASARPPRASPGENMCIIPQTAFPRRDSSIGREEHGRAPDTPQ